MYSANPIVTCILSHWAGGIGPGEQGGLGPLESGGHQCSFLVTVSGGKRTDEILKCYKGLLIDHGLIHFDNAFS